MGLGVQRLGWNFKENFMQHPKRSTYYKRLWLVLLMSVITACADKPTAFTDFNPNAAAKARVALAYAYLEQHSWAAAKRNLDKALAYAPKSPQVLAAFAAFYQAQQNFPKATQFYVQALRQPMPNIAGLAGDIHHNFGVMLCEAGQFQKAYEQFHQALATPEYFHQKQTYENQARCALKAKDFQRYEQFRQQLQPMLTEN